MLKNIDMLKLTEIKSDNKAINELYSIAISASRTIARGENFTYREDLVQDTILDLLSKLDKYSESYKPSTFIYLLMKNIHSRKKRNETRKRENLKMRRATEIRSNGEPISKRLEINEELNYIKERGGDNFYLISQRYLRGLTPKQMAELEGIPRGTIGSRLNKTTLKIKENSRYHRLSLT